MMAILSLPLVFSSVLKPHCRFSISFLFSPNRRRFCSKHQFSGGRRCLSATTGSESASTAERRRFSDVAVSCSAARTVPTFQQAIQRLQEYWASVGCAVMQCSNTELQDVVTFLDPPRELIPNDPSSYNPAFYLWKKIDDIPEERRHRLILLLKPRLISTAWAIAGARYNYDKLTRRCSSDLLSSQADSLSFESWHCRKSGGPLSVSLLNFFKMALFRKDGECYGRFIAGSFLGRFANSFSPLYFTVRQLDEVMPTEQPCDLACELGDGLLDILDLPPGFPKSARHPQPFDDHVVVYIRHVGPGVMVGQAWQEGLDLEQVPKKFCGEILMVKDYAASSYGDKV